MNVAGDGILACYLNMIVVFIFKSYMSLKLLRLEENHGALITSKPKNRLLKYQ